MSNKELHQESIDNVNLSLIEKAIFVAYREGVTSVAPLGYGGETILLYGKNEPKRVSQISIRNHSGDAKLLITDSKGSFIFYGGFDIDLGVDFVANAYMGIINSVKDKIDTDMPNIEFCGLKEAENCRHSEGFEMMRLFHMR